MRECKVCRKRLNKPEVKGADFGAWLRRLCPSHNEYVNTIKGGEPYSTPEELREVKDFKRGR